MKRASATQIQCSKPISPSESFQPVPASALRCMDSLLSEVAASYHCRTQQHEGPYSTSIRDLPDIDRR